MGRIPQGGVSIWNIAFQPDVHHFAQIGRLFCRFFGFRGVNYVI